MWDKFAGFAHGLRVRWLHREPEIICLEDAAITKFARLTAGGELHEAGACGDIDGDGDAFLALDHVAVACCYVPDAPGYAFLYLLHPITTLAVGQAAIDEPHALRYAAEL